MKKHVHLTTNTPIFLDLEIKKSALSYKPKKDT
jgi:hypothetical protein